MEPSSTAWLSGLWPDDLSQSAGYSQNSSSIPIDCISFLAFWCPVSPLSETTFWPWPLLNCSLLLPFSAAGSDHVSSTRCWRSQWYGSCSVQNFLRVPNLSGQHVPFCFLPCSAKHRTLKLKNYRVIRKTALISFSFHKWENVVLKMYNHLPKEVQTLNSGFLIHSPLHFQKKKEMLTSSGSLPFLSTTHLCIILQIWGWVSLIISVLLSSVVFKFLLCI